MTPDQFTPQDPTTQFPQPEQPNQKLDYPGLESEMSARPDYGEQSYRGSDRLVGRRAVITGGDSGIGRAVALAFAREGADVLIGHLEEEESDARETVSAIEEAGRQAVAMAGDVGDEAHCRALVERAVQEFGGIDLLVNNAAFQMARDSIAEFTAEVIEHTFRTNIFAMFYTCQAALEHMQPGSCIINSASVQAYKPAPRLLDYAATKAAIVNFTASLAQETIEKGIRVNAVAPGPVWTPLIPATMPEEKVVSHGVESPTARAGQPVELAPAYVFLASQESSYINGETIRVTGGVPIL